MELVSITEDTVSLTNSFSSIYTSMEETSNNGNDYSSIVVVSIVVYV